LARLPIKVTPNVFLAFFATFASATSMIPLAEAISQWKWNWIQKEDRPLADLQLFDDASRGVLGSVLLLRHLSYRYVAVLAY